MAIQLLSLYDLRSNAQYGILGILAGILIFTAMIEQSFARKPLISNKEELKEGLSIGSQNILSPSELLQNGEQEEEIEDDKSTQLDYKNTLRLETRLNHIFVDPLSGYAISGFDPVAYHLDFKAREGKKDYELLIQNRIWRFANAGNRAAFLEDQETYVPAFAGYDVVNMSNGYLAYGAPEIWALYEGHIYFFRNSENRTKFAQEPKLALENALRQWENKFSHQQ